MNCIILADKPRKRNKTKGWNGCLPINSKKTLVENQISVLQSCFDKIKIYYVYGFDAKNVEDFFEKKNYKNVIPIKNTLFETTGEINSISKTRQFLNTDTLLISGNVILSRSMFKNFSPSNSKSTIFISEKENKELGCSIDKANKITHLCYDLDNFFCEIVYLRKKHIEKFRTMVSKKEYRNYFLFEIINKMIDIGIDFEPYISTKQKLFLTV